MTSETFIVCSILLFVFSSLFLKNKLVPLAFSSMVSLVGLFMSPWENAFVVCLVGLIALSFINGKKIAQKEEEAFFYLSVLNSFFYLFGEENLLSYLCLIIFYNLLIVLKNLFSKKHPLDHEQTYLKLLIMIVSCFFIVDQNIYFISLMSFILCFLSSGIFFVKKFDRKSLEFTTLSFLIPLCFLKYIYTVRLEYHIVHEIIFYITMIVVSIFFILKNWLVLNTSIHRHQIFCFNIFLLLIYGLSLDYVTFEESFFLMVVNLALYHKSETLQGVSRMKAIGQVIMSLLILIYGIILSVRGDLSIGENLSKTQFAVVLCLTFIPFLMYVALIKGKRNEI